MKYTIKFVFSIISFLMTSAVFSQYYTDQEIGLNVARITTSLKERGVTDEGISKEISMMREIYKRQYLGMKEIQDALLQKIKAEQGTKAKTSRLASAFGLAGDTIPETERAALQALYNSTDGEHWTNNSGWDFTQPVTSWDAGNQTGWFGITVTNGHVISIDLNYNNLNGFLTDLSVLTELTILNLKDNNFESNVNIPTWLNSLANLKLINLNRCKFQGPFPNLSSLTGLELLNLGINNFNPGDIPLWIYTLTNLEILNLHFCNLTGAININIGELKQLTTLTLEENQLSGSIPETITLLDKLIHIRLNENQLTGNMPNNIGNLKELNSLVIYQNQLSGAIPLSITELAKLNYLNLFSNFFEGSIPNLTNLPLLEDVYISGNKFRFVDFSTEFTFYKNNFSFFGYSPQSKTDTIATPTHVLGNPITFTMCEDGRFLPDDTFQWYKNNSLIPGATNRIYQLNNLTQNDAGVYTCKSYHTTNPDMSPLVLERNAITLTIENCAPVSGTIKILTTPN